MNDNRIYIPLSHRPAEERPRERLLRYGADKLSSAELLAILLRVGTRGRSAVQVAQELLDNHEGSVASIEKLSPAELARICGIGNAKAAALAAAFALAKRANATPPHKGDIRLETVEDVANHFRRHYGAGSPEKFVAFYINRKYRLLGELEISRGSSNAVVVNPQRVFKEAVLRDAKAVILAHNHPSGDGAPSKRDIALTEDMRKAGKLFRIPLAEHVIVTNYSVSTVEMASD